MADIITTCLLKEGEDVTDRVLLQCAIAEMNNANIANNMIQSNPARQIAIIIGASVVFFMQAGFAMVCAGSVRRKNVQNTMLKNLLDACGASLAFFAVGYALAFGGSDPTSATKTFIGTSNFFLHDVQDYSFWTFQYAFSAASATIVAGALSERCQMISYIGYSILLSGLVYPIVAHALWDAQGFLSAFNVEPLFNVGMIDFAGSAVVHITGGATALIAATIIGPRRGRFHDEMGRPLENPEPIKGHSPALQLLGTFILWFGWYSFNSLSAILTTLNETTARVAGLAAVTTTISAGTASIVALTINFWLCERQNPGYGVLDLQFAMNGSLGGLVAITAGCAVVEPWAALIIGILSGCAYVATNRFLSRFRIDDAVDAVPVHLSCGIIGIICVGLFSSPSRQYDAYGRADHVGLFYSLGNGKFDAVLIGTQLLGIGIILIWVTVIMLPFFYLLDKVGWLRCDALEEIVGLDFQHTPDLTDTMPITNTIKEEEIGMDHFEAYKKQRQAKNDEILRKREALNNFGKAVSTACSNRMSISSRRDASEGADGDLRSVTVDETTVEESRLNSLSRKSWSPAAFQKSFQKSKSVVNLRIPNEM